MIYFILKKKNNFWLRACIVIGTFGIINLYSLILQTLINIGIFNSKFERYLSGTFGFEFNPVLIRIPFIILIFVIYKSFSNYCSKRYSSLGKGNSDFLIILLIIEIFTAEMRAILPALYRISFYFGYAKIIAYSRIAKIHPKYERIIYSTLIVVFLIILWIYQNIYQGANDIYPYKSIIIGIR